MTSADERLTGPLSGYHYLRSSYDEEPEIPEHLRKRYKVKEGVPFMITAAGIVCYIYSKLLYQGGGGDKKGH